RGEWSWRGGTRLPGYPECHSGVSQDASRLTTTCSFLREPGHGRLSLLRQRRKNLVLVSRGTRQSQSSEQFFRTLPAHGSHAPPATQRCSEGVASPTWKSLARQSGISGAASVSGKRNRRRNPGPGWSGSERILLRS